MHFMHVYCMYMLYLYVFGKALHSKVSEANLSRTILSYSFIVQLFQLPFAVAYKITLPIHFDEIAI